MFFISISFFLEIPDNIKIIEQIIIKYPIFSLGPACGIDPDFCVELLVFVTVPWVGIVIPVPDDVGVGVPVGLG